MLIQFDNDIQIKDWEDVFSFHYPYLKIKLYAGAGAKKIKSPNKIAISGGETVAWLQQAFKDRLDLSAKMYRKQNQGWVEISGDDTLTLAEQNERGRTESAHNETRYEDFLETEF